jgi:hypothetical protein
MAKINEILGYKPRNGIFDISNIGVAIYLDPKVEDNQNLPLEVVYDKEKDGEYKNIEMQVSKIYNAFMYGHECKVWKPIIIEKFEPSTQIDFMMLVSAVYMREADTENKETRIAESMSIVAAILTKYIIM